MISRDCPHTNATADVLEGDGRGHQVVWCRDCGAYARKFDPGTTEGGWTTEWRLPRKEPLEICPRCQGTRVLPGGVNCPCRTGFVDRSDNVSLPGEEDEEPGEGEAGLPEGRDPDLVIRPLCPECGSTEVTLAHVHSAQADVPALAVLCDACHLATIGQVPREQLDAVIRRVRSTRSGDWRYRVSPA